MNQLITPEWIMQDMLRSWEQDRRFIEGDQWPADVRAQRIAAGRPVLVFPPAAPIVPPSLLIAGLAVAVAAKVPFSRRTLLMPWKVGSE